MHLRSKTVQQLLSVILSVVMVLSMLPMEVLAQETPPVTTPMDLTAITEDTSGDGWSWTQKHQDPDPHGPDPDGQRRQHPCADPARRGHHRSGRRYRQHPHRRQQIHRIQRGEVKLRGSGSLTVYGRGLARRHAGYVHPRHADGGV